jgi:methionyl-tRNA formyltransferase
MKLTPSAVAHEAERLGLPVSKPLRLSESSVQDMLREIEADVMVVAAYGLLLPQGMLDIPRYGCINIHGSLLPRWRGAAPVQRAIEAGDKETGITIMQMDAGLDTGAILLEKKITIDPEETSETLFVKLTALGAQAIAETLADLPAFVPRPQPTDGASYAKKILKSEARIDWNQSAVVIERRIRAFDPFPGCESRLAAEPFKIWRARVVEDGASHPPPGTIIEVDRGILTVQCGNQQLQLLVVQKGGSKRMMVDEFLRGNSVSKGAVLS